MILNTDLSLQASYPQPNLRLTAKSILEALEILGFIVMPQLLRMTPKAGMMLIGMV